MGLYAVLVVHTATPNQAYVPTATNPLTAFTQEQVLVYSEVDTALHAAVAADGYGPGPGKAYTSMMTFDPNYYLINGQSYDVGSTPLYLGIPTEAVLLRFVNAGYETRVPVMQGDYFSLIAEDGNLLPYPTELYSIELTAGKTKDVLWDTPASGITNIYDARFNLTNNGNAGGGLLAKLEFSGNGEVVAPNGGEQLTGLSPVEISWLPHPDADSYTVRFSQDGGGTWTNLINQDAASGTSYSWAIPNDIDSESCLIRVAAYTNTWQWLGVDDSDGVFSITPAGTVLMPNGGEAFNGGDNTTITWVAHPDAASYTVRFSQDNGTTWTNLINQDAALGTSYSWSVPNIDSPNCLIRVAPYGAAWLWLGADDSDDVFSITPAVL